MNNTLILIMMAHIFWTALLYAVLTIMRAPKVWGIGMKADGSDPWINMEPRVSANLSNQFEWPLFFHVACVIILANPTVHSPAYVWLGILFLLGRFMHSGVQILTTNIRVRGIVFTINFMAVLGMWALLGMSVIQQTG